jgi:glycosyltransferase involved in cell wall biosynthesis/GT2 family glycosyltransferase
MTIDVIVPVSSAASGIHRCVESLLACVQLTPFEIVVVDDATGNSSSYLRALADARRITLVEQPTMQGTASALNRAIALHRGLERDAVILSSDCEPAGDWLDRLARHAAQEDVGMVVSFSNAGGVAGYPRTDRRNGMPGGLDAVTLDRLFARANADAAVELPVATGPCVYIRRECLNAVGAFSAVNGASDGEGVLEDFSLRASAAGFRHLLAADCYIWRSQSPAAEATAERINAALDKRHPNSRIARAQLALRDPARPFARRVDLVRLAESTRPLLLFVAHAWGGGIRKHMDELATMLAPRCDVLLLEPAEADAVKLSWLSDGEAFAAFFTLPQDAGELTRLLRELGVGRVHFHHVHGLPRSVLDLPKALGVAYDCTLHDYYAICPQYHLVTADGRYCGEPDAAGCNACIAARPAQWGLDIGGWRAEFATLLRGADRLFAPSRDVAERIGRYIPRLDITVLPHPEMHAGAPRVVRVATLGGLSPEKGLHVVAACAADARLRSLPLAFRVLGWTTQPLAQWPAAPVSVHGQYQDADLPALIAAERPDVIWFPAQVPESYSYTLSAALGSDAAIVASSFGALVERLEGNPRARLVPADATPRQWNDALLEAGAASPARVELPRRRVS